MRVHNLVGMAHITVSDLAYAHPGGELLFSGVSFRVAAGRHAGLVGSTRDLTLEFGYIDESGFDWTCTAALRRDGKTVDDRTRWTVRKVKPKLLGPARD
jgi:hypothetical protein